MIHHRRVAGGDHPHQPTPTVPSNSHPGFTGRSHATIVGDQGTSEAPASARDGLVSDSTPAEAGALHSSARRSIDKLRRRVAIVAAIGVFALLIAGELLTNILGSSARSTPLLPLDENNPDETQDTAVATAGVGVDWKKRVAGCTGPEDGFVYGGDPGQVLTFVQSGRGEAAAGGAAADDPALAYVLRWFWKLKHDRGVLSYEVNEEIESRREVGAETGWEIIFTRNVGRNKPFPQAGPAEEPWDPSSFNFYKASPLEFVLSYTPSFRYERDEAAALQAGVIPVEIDAAAGAAAAAAGEAKTATLGALRGAGDKLNLDVPAAAGSVGDFPLTCGEVSTAAPPQDAVLVNIRPVGAVSLLLTPGYPHSHHQRATAESLAVAMDFAEALRGDPGFRLGFNSAGSSASVNHLHIQCWYFDAGPRGLAIETSKSVHVATVPLRRRSSAEGVEENANGAVEVHRLDGYPIRTLVFHTLGTDLEAVGEVMEKCVNFLVEENTPHTIVFTTGRAFLLPRQHLEKPPWAVVPGFPEVSGEIIVTTEEDYRTITADEVFEWWRDKIAVNAEHFDRIADACLK